MQKSPAQKKRPTGRKEFTNWLPVKGMTSQKLQKHSDGPSSTKGGDLGKFKFEVMAKPFSEAAFSLDVGSVSEVVETDFGFHVIKRTG